MAEEKEPREPGAVRYRLGRLREKGFGRLLCLLGRHRFREEGVTICMRCLKQEIEWGTQRSRSGMRNKAFAVTICVGIAVSIFMGWIPGIRIGTSGGAIEISSPYDLPQPLELPAVRLLPAMDSFQFNNMSKIAEDFGPGAIENYVTLLSLITGVSTEDILSKITFEGFVVTAQKSTGKRDQYGGLVSLTIGWGPSAAALQRNLSAPENLLIHDQNRVKAFSRGAVLTGTAEGIKGALDVAHGKVSTMAADPGVIELARRFPDAFSLMFSVPQNDSPPGVLWEGFAARKSGDDAEIIFVSRFANESAATDSWQGVRDRLEEFPIRTIWFDDDTVLANMTMPLLRFMAAFSIGLAPPVAVPEISLLGTNETALCIQHRKGNTLLLDGDNTSIVVDGVSHVDYTAKFAGGATEGLGGQDFALVSGLSTLKVGSEVRFVEAAAGLELANFTVTSLASGTLRCL